MPDLDSPVEAMANYKEPSEEVKPKICKHRKHTELSKVIADHMQVISYVLDELEVIKTFIGKEKLCPIRKKLNKIKALEASIRIQQREISKIKSEL